MANGLDGVRTSTRRGVLIEAALIGLLALLVRLLNLDHTPWTDEFNHLLAARSLLSAGTLELVTGGHEYYRGALFTYLVAGFVKVGGESLVVARLPAVLAGSALVAALFLAVRAVGDRLSAWSAGLLLCFAPIAIQTSQLVRFYTLHALLFFLAAAFIYRLTAPPPPSRGRVVWLVLAASLTLGLALHLQLITVIGAGALGLWLCLTGLPALIRSARARGRLAWLLIGLAAAVLVLALAVERADLWARAWRRFETADYWARDARDQLRFYDWLFIDRYPTLWSLFPLLALVAASRWLRAALFGTLVFASAFLVHSLAAWKTERYLFYALPFFFGVCGLALGVILPWAYRTTGELVSRLAGGGWQTRRIRLVTLTLLAGALLFTVAQNGATSYSARMLLGKDGDWSLVPRYRGESDWPHAQSTLRALADDVDVIISSSELKALYYLGRLDFDLVPEEFGWSGNRTPEHPFSEKSGRAWVATEESLRQAMSCFRSGLVIVETGHWREPIGVTDGQADYLESNAVEHALPEAWRLHAFTWNRGSSGDAEPGEECGAVLAAREQGTRLPPPAPIE